MSDLKELARQLSNERNPKRRKKLKQKIAELKEKEFLKKVWYP